MNIIDVYRKQIADIEKKIEDIQDRCSHPSVEEEKWGVPGDAHMGTSSRGGSRFTCNLCHKTWSTSWKDD